jgi:hypothetical protein
MKREAGDDESACAALGTRKALKEALRAQRPRPDLADEVRELREFIGPAQDRWPD